MAMQPQGLARSLKEEYVYRRGLLLQVVPNSFVGSRRSALFQSAFSKFTSDPWTNCQFVQNFCSRSCTFDRGIAEES